MNKKDEEQFNKEFWDEIRNDTKKSMQFVVDDVLKENGQLDELLKKQESDEIIISEDEKIKEENKKCSKCKSFNIKIEENFKDIFIRYKCKDCGYEGDISSIYLT